jgi:hypothetical protein
LILDLRKHKEAPMVAAIALRTPNATLNLSKNPIAIKFTRNVVNMMNVTCYG